LSQQIQQESLSSIHNTPSKISYLKTLTKRNIFLIKKLEFFLFLGKLLSESLHQTSTKFTVLKEKRREGRIAVVQSNRKEGTDYISIKLIRIYRLPPKSRNCFIKKYFQVKNSVSIDNKKDIVVAFQPYGFVDVCVLHAALV
jgi:hypothetical protein